MGGRIKASFLEELETQQWEQAGLDGIEQKAGSRVSKDPGPSHCPTPHALVCILSFLCPRSLSSYMR